MSKPSSQNARIGAGRPRRRFTGASRLVGIVLALLLWNFDAAAWDRVEAAGAGATNAAPGAPPPLRALSPTEFQLGLVTLDKARRTIQFPAEMNLASGLVEYLLVATNGKAYESVLATPAQPYHIHLAMLLIGARGAPDTAALRAMPEVPFHVNRRPGDTNPAPPAVAGDAIDITLAWTNAGAARQLAASDVLRDLETKTNASPGPWTYNGSRVIKGNFIAQRDGSIVAVIDDVDALVNNPRPGHDNDQIWEVNSNALPPLHTAVEVTFTLKGKP